MKTYTQADYDGFPVVDGIRQCPTGDYSQIKTFPEHCSFGEWSRFGEQCGFGMGCRFGRACSFGEVFRFGDRCSFECIQSKPGYPFLTFGGGGSVNRTIYCFNTIDGLIFRAGCFVGSKDEFVEKVLADDESQDKSNLKTKQYMGFVDLCELTFK